MRTIGELWLGGDWACAHGDVEALRHVATSLADRTSRPLRDELLAVAEACYRDPDRAATAWFEVKARAH